MQRFQLLNLDPPHLVQVGIMQPKSAYMDPGIRITIDIDDAGLAVESP